MKVIIVQIIVNTGSKSLEWDANVSLMGVRFTSNMTQENVGNDSNYDDIGEDDDNDHGNCG